MGFSDHNNSRAALAALFAATALLAGCGGGGGGDAPAPAPAPSPGPAPAPAPAPGTGATPSSLEQVQGFWGGALDAGSTAEAIALRNGELWVVVQAGGAVRSVGKAQGVVGANGVTATGVLTDLVTGASQALTVQVTAIAPKATLTGSLLATSPARSVSWAYSARYDTTLPVADFAGRWSSTAGQQRLAVSWDITAAGALTGTSTTGCAYSGTLATHTQASSIASLSLKETCAGASQTFSGIATMNEARSQASFVLGNAAGSDYAFVALQK